MTAIASDNDHETEQRLGRNPGHDAAKKASLATGAGIALPKCTIGTDWNDFYCERLAELREENLFRHGRKKTERELRIIALSELRLAVMSACVFIQHQ